MRGHLEIPPLIPMDATTIYLDGNNFTGMLESQAFIGRKRVINLYLNGSRIEAINNQTFNGLTELEVLYLQDNVIQRLQGYEFSNLTSLIQLNLENNRLVYIDAMVFSTLVSLEEVHLAGNQLVDYPIWELKRLPHLGKLFLANNPWSCECDFIKKFQALATIERVADLDRVQCFSPDVEVYVDLGDNVTCSDALAVTHVAGKSLLSASLAPALVTVTAVCIIVVAASLILFVFRTPLRVWLHSKYGVRILESGGCKKEPGLYDALVSCSAKDQDFVHQGRHSPNYS
jgi:hypothetical protein